MAPVKLGPHFVGKPNPWPYVNFICIFGFLSAWRIFYCLKFCILNKNWNFKGKCEIMKWEKWKGNFWPKSGGIVTPWPLPFLRLCCVWHERNALAARFILRPLLGNRICAGLKRQTSFHDPVSLPNLPVIRFLRLCQKVWNTVTWDVYLDKNFAAHV